MAHRPWHHLRCVTIALPIATAIGCADGDRSTGPRDLRPLSQVVAGEARASLSSTGQFALGAPPQAANEIGQDRARELAKALVKTYDSLGGLPHIDEEHGAPVDQAAVVPCRRAIYARSPWEPLEAAITATAGGAVVQRSNGSWWLVPFCDGAGELAMLVSVSVYATDLSVKDGMIVFPRYGGEWFHWNGVPQSQRDELPVGPENAAVLAATLTGRQVTAVPEFEAPSRREGFPAAGHWRIQLDTPGEVRLQRTGETVKAPAIYVGWRPMLDMSSADVPASEQPETMEVRYPINLDTAKPGEAIQEQALTLRRREGATVKFELVSSTNAITH